MAKINAYTIGYSHSFGIAGRMASLALLAPYADANPTGNVEGNRGLAYRAGLGDVRSRFVVILLGGPALTPEQFARYSLGTSLGASLSVVAPTGQYVPPRLINVGANRWAFHPHIGLSQPIGNWFVKTTAGVWVFTD
ncbi:transporter [Pararobbsia alpina]|uniref:transporter n=1 Tax=Pararobbsia alpina TaxID=621374 RepID=UPI001FEBCA36|nr:transporter [Pararobbsia alpina]